MANICLSNTIAAKVMNVFIATDVIKNKMWLSIFAHLKHLAMDYGWLALVPPLVVIILSIILKMSFEAMLVGCLVGLAMLDGWGFFNSFVTALYTVLKQEGNIWVILVCGLYGSLMALMIRSGGAFSFGEMILRKLRSRRSALLGTWGLGIFIFLDDYLSSLTVGLTMRKVTDKFGISREMLAYFTNTTAANICLLVPISTWSIFVSPILESSQVAAKGEGLATFVRIIPYMAFPIAAVGVAFLVALGVLPLIGKMKRSEARAAAGQPIPDGIKLSQAAGLEPFEDNKPRAIYFLLPLVVLLVATVAFQDSATPGLEIDALKGVMIAVAFTFVYFLLMRVASFQNISETVFSGFNSMIYALALLMLSLVLKDVCERMNLTKYVIESVTPYVSSNLMPLAIFVALAFLGYTTGSSWGMYAIAIPIAAALARSSGAPMFACVGAVISAGAVASNWCLYSDCSVLTSQSCETNNLDHHFTQMPYMITAFLVACIMFTLFGYMG